MLFRHCSSSYTRRFSIDSIQNSPRIFRKSSRILSRIHTNIFCCDQSRNSSRHPFSRNIKVISGKILLGFHFGTIPWTSSGIPTGIVLGTSERVQLSNCSFFLSAIARAKLSRIPPAIFYSFFPINSGILPKILSRIFARIPCGILLGNFYGFLFPEIQTRYSSRASRRFFLDFLKFVSSYFFL